MVATSNASDLNRSSSEPLHRKTTLDNGLRIVTGSMPHTHSVTISIFVGVGSRHESDQHAGVSHFLEHLLFKGTTLRPEPEMISAPVEGVGGILNAETEQEMTVYWCKVPNPYLLESLDLLIDIIRNPLLAEPDIEKERAVVIDELSMIHDNPDYKVETLIDAMLWPEHPLGRDVGGSRDTVLRLNHDVIANHLESYYVPSNIVVSVAGAIDHESIAAHLEALTGDWAPGVAPKCLTFKGRPSPPQVRMDYRKSEQAHLSIGLPGLSLFHPDRYALDVLNIAIGEGMSSRLFLELRERRGLAYDVHSTVTHFRDCGSFQIFAGTEPGRIYDAVDTIMTEIADIRKGIPRDEFEKARRLASGRLMLSMEDTRTVSSWFGAQEILLNEIRGLNQAIDRLDALKIEDLDRVARNIFVANGLSMAVVGPCRGMRRLQKSLIL